MGSCHAKKGKVVKFGLKESDMKLEPIQSDQMIVLSGLEENDPLPDHIKAFMEHEKFILVSKTKSRG
jgi:hypothetical protein